MRKNKARILCLSKLSFHALNTENGIAIMIIIVVITFSCHTYMMACQLQ